MLNINLHNVESLKLESTKLFNNFASRNIVLVVKDYDGNLVEHVIALYGQEYKALCPVIDTTVTRNGGK